MIAETKIPEGDDYASLNGLLHERLQDIPQEGDKLELNDLKILIFKKDWKNLKKWLLTAEST